MSKPIIKSIVEEHPFSEMVLFENGKYIVFGNTQYSDLVKIGMCPKVKSNSLYLNGKIQDLSGSGYEGLYKQIHELYDPSLIGSLRIQSYQVKFIQKTIKIFGATHIKFYGNEDGIFVNFFDVLRSISEARMNRKHETRLLFHQLKNQPVNSFEMTFNSGSFSLLPPKSLHIGFGDNKIGIFTDDDSDEVYLLRDPEVIQPVIHTFNDRLGQDISFSLPSNPSLLNLGTNQPENLELESDLEDF
jgi:hypothetical protein